MARLRLPFLFLGFLFVFLSLAFVLHIQILQSQGLTLFENLIVRSYVVNTLLAAAIFFVIYHFRWKLGDQIGFLFMGGSLVKFLLFFVLFYPTYIEDETMSRQEFGAFFIPYATALAIETVFVSKSIKNLRRPPSKQHFRPSRK